MRIALYHGYELTGSGSNEYNRYLARALAREGHDVHVICREPKPEAIAPVARARVWAADGSSTVSFERAVEGGYEVHVLPHGDVRPVYLTDKQRDGHVKAFSQLTDAELSAYHALNVATVGAIVREVRPDVVIANHLVWQPSVAVELDVPVIVFPHGSAIEYTVRTDERYRKAAGDALARADGVISGSREVLDRIVTLYPELDIEEHARIVGVGVDTALFTPIPKVLRDTAMGRLDGPYAGKAVSQRVELRTRLDTGDFDAVTDYRTAYDQKSPDVDTADRLRTLNWEQDRILLFVGALTAGKGLHSLIAALPAVLDRHPRTHLLVVGSGAFREVLEALVHAIATGNQKLFDHLCNNALSLDASDAQGGWPDVGGTVPHAPAVADHVHFLGRLDHDKLRWVFPCADLAVFPSVVPEAYPLVLMEALANGVLPVVSDFTGFRDGLDQLEPLLGSEWVDRMRLPVEPEGRVEGIAVRLIALLGEDLTPIGPRLREIAVEHFDWAVRARELAGAYRALAAPK